MKVLTVVTPPHQIYLDRYFLPTFPWETNLDLIISRIPHVCPSGNFMSPGFNEICRLKMQRVSEMCNRFANEIILYCDLDVMFYTNNIIDPVLEALGDKDMVFINDGNNQYGCGVFAVNANHRTRSFFPVLDGMIPEHRDDQDALNALIRDQEEVTHGFLPDTFFGIGKDFGYWPRKEGDAPIEIPEKIILHHGNFATGLNNKTDLLNHVNELWQLKQQSNG